MTVSMTVETSPQHETEDLSRSVEFRLAETSNDGLTLEGYAAVFNDWTTVRDHAGEFQERIAPGAFKRTIGITKPVLQFDHGSHPLIGSLPLGKITRIKEDDHGLFVRARMHDNWLVAPVRDAIRDGSVTGMSFRFSVAEGGDVWETRDGVEYRTITEVKLYEVGPVVFPCYESSSVGVRSRQCAIALTDPEVRREVATLFTLGTDHIRNLADESPATPPAPPEGTSGSSDAPAESHASTRTKAQRQAIAALALSH